MVPFKQCTPNTQFPVDDVPSMKEQTMDETSMTEQTMDIDTSLDSSIQPRRNPRRNLDRFGIGISH